MRWLMDRNDATGDGLNVSRACPHNNHQQRINSISLNETWRHMKMFGKLSGMVFVAVTAITQRGMVQLKSKSWNSVVYKRFRNHWY